MSVILIFPCVRGKELPGCHSKSRQGGLFHLSCENEACQYRSVCGFYSRIVIVTGDEAVQ